MTTHLQALPILGRLAESRSDLPISFKRLKLTYLQITNTSPSSHNDSGSCSPIDPNLHENGHNTVVTDSEALKALSNPLIHETKLNSVHDSPVSLVDPTAHVVLHNLEKAYIAESLSTQHHSWEEQRDVPTHIHSLQGCPANFGLGTVHCRCGAHTSNETEYKEKLLGETDHNMRAREDSKIYCLHSGCTNSSGFTRKWDLKRHYVTAHSDTPPQWSCGCCENSNSEKRYRYKRKDKLSQHMLKKHRIPTRSYPCQFCTSATGVEHHFSSRSCLEFHLHRDHPEQLLNNSQLSQALDENLVQGWCRVLYYLP